MSAAAYVKEIIAVFESEANVERAQKMSKYMRGQYAYFGLKTPHRKALQKPLLQKIGFPEGKELQKVVNLLWAAPQRELQYTAMELMKKRLRTMDLNWLPFVEKLVLEKSWWDTVDWLAAHAVGGILKKHPEQIHSITSRYIESDNIWLQRVALLFQLFYREQTDFDLLQSHILYRIDSKEFFVQKGAGWALRQYARNNPQAVQDFVALHSKQLPPLTKREALKHF